MMRNRYYSPGNSSPIKSPLKQQKQSPVKAENKLRQAVSSKKLPIGQTFGAEKKVGPYAYNVSQQIGRGFSSIVYQGVHIRDKTRCAVKAIDTNSYSPSSMRMLQNEIKIMKALDHPNIVKLLDVYRTLTHCYLITEYCPSGDLASLIGKQGRLSEPQATDIMRQVVDAVKHLFEKGILHRDLKPANILRAEKCWKIADFGFAIFAEERVKSRYNVGTPLYMSPQTLVDNVYSPESQVFSVGVILYELIAGKTPWETKCEKNLVKKIKDEPYRFPEEIVTNQSIKNLLQHMCCKIPELRMKKKDFMSLDLQAESLRQVINSQHNTKGEGHENKRQKSLINKLEQYSETNLTSEKKNHNILVNQLQYCRFLSYFAKNIKHLQVNSKNRNKLGLLIHKHIDKLIKVLASSKNNSFNLDNWKDFKESPKYLAFMAIAKEYAERFSKDYTEYLRGIEMVVAQQVNKSFPLFTGSVLSREAYEEIMQFLENNLREGNHNLTVLTKGAKQPLEGDLRISIEALKSLFKYYQLINLSLSHFNNFLAFEKQSSIRVLTDYGTCSNRIEDYSQLREELRSI